MFYKDTNNKPFFEPSAQVIEKFNLTEITEAEFNQIVEAVNIPTAEQVLQQQLREAEQYLKDTDYVVVKMAEAQSLGVDITDMKAEYADVIAEREAKRQFIRENR